MRGWRLALCVATGGSGRKNNRKKPMRGTCRESQCQRKKEYPGDVKKNQLWRRWVDMIGKNLGA